MLSHSDHYGGGHNSNEKCCQTEEGGSANDPSREVLRDQDPARDLMAPQLCRLVPGAPQDQHEAEPWYLDPRLDLGPSHASGTFRLLASSLMETSKDKHDGDIKEHLGSFLSES